ncbi:3-deoxy-D-manno-octulosonic acid transferase [Candidatus Sumerlaeota bacterium]|nr:3-deoxy-D-manno-octulosonic acid transferase [Candidatus Sumerlaeota bacterium]
MSFTDFLYLAGAPFFLPPYLFKILVRKKYRTSSKGMLGFMLPKESWAKEKGRLNLWLHAVSVGEVVAGKAVLSEWNRAFPDSRILASTVTETGQQKARQILKEAREFSFFPLDFTPIVRKFLSTFNPDIYIMMETEIWPNFLREAAKKGTKIFLANGTLSDRSFSRWNKFKSLFQRTFDSITAACVQSEEDKRKFEMLLKRPDAILVTGNCKFDSPGSPLSPEERLQIFSRLKITPQDPVVVIGSTHAGEEEIMIEAWKKARRNIPRVKFILAPRHPERFDTVARLLKQNDIRFSRYSDPALDDPDMILVDAMGVLARLYGAGKIAVVAGSFSNIGGHNLLEAAIHKIPVLYGPDMHDQSELVKIFHNSEGALCAQKEELAPTLERLLSNEEERRRRGEAAALTAHKNRGSARRTIDFIRKFIEKT